MPEEAEEERSVLPRWWSAPRVRQALTSVGLALLIAGITTLAVKVFGWQSARWRTAAVAAAPKHGLPRAGSTASAAVRKQDLEHDQKLVAVPPEPDAREPKPRASSNAPDNRRLSASAMFAGAALARARGDDAEALRLCLQIEEFFPNSAEGINTHVVLGQLYLQRHQPALALQEFALFRQIGAPEAKAEALWGQSHALRELNRSEDERIVLEELLRSYPRSVYVAASRSRVAELTLDAAVH